MNNRLLSTSSATSQYDYKRASLLCEKMVSKAVGFHYEYFQNEVELE